MQDEDKFLRLVQGKRIYLRNIVPDDVNGIYCRWMNDPATNRFLESRFYPHSLETLRKYVVNKHGDNLNAFFAIVLKDGDRHIGNIKLGPIDSNHHLADIGILIGEEDCWGKGYATEAISLVVDYAFDVLALHKVTAGCYAPNKGAIGAFEKAGFIQEGVRKAHCFFEGAYVDDILLGLVSPKVK
jgi:[ribosomal protein S5]-alanine N-acetyltransferase